MSEQEEREKYNQELAEQAYFEEQCAARDAQLYEEIAALEAKVSRLEAALRAIRDHEHCDSYSCAVFAEGSSWPELEAMKRGTCFGHRCAAEIARKALEGEK